MQLSASGHGISNKFRHKNLSAKSQISHFSAVNYVIQFDKQEMQFQLYNAKFLEQN